MLILQRKKKQSISIGSDIVITILETGSDQVKIAIEAPRSISIVRGELLEAAAANKEAADLSKETLEHLTGMLLKQNPR